MILIIAFSNTHTHINIPTFQSNNKTILVPCWSNIWHSNGQFYLAWIWRCSGSTLFKDRVHSFIMTTRTYSWVVACISRSRIEHSTTFKIWHLGLRSNECGGQHHCSVPLNHRSLFFNIHGCDVFFAMEFCIYKWSLIFCSFLILQLYRR